MKEITGQWTELAAAVRKEAWRVCAQNRLKGITGQWTELTAAVEQAAWRVCAQK